MMSNSAETLDNEREWRPVPGDWGDRYQVSNDGQVRSVDIVITDTLGRTRRQAGRVLKQTTCSFGYKRVELRQGGRSTRKSFSMHRLVAEVFIGPPESDDLEAMHGDHNPANNHVDNLKWGTHTENVRSSIEDGRYGPNHNARKTRCPQGHKYSGFDARGTRKCGECRRVSQTRYNRKRRASCLQSAVA